jgi:predicted nucleotidyltransferase
MPIALKDEERNLVKSLVKAYVPDVKIYAYGSRTTDDVKPYSDLDIALDKNGEKIDFRNIFDIKELMSASRLPFLVDVSDWSSLSDEFKDIIKDDLVEL